MIIPYFWTCTMVLSYFLTHTIMCFYTCTSVILWGGGGLSVLMIFLEMYYANIRGSTFFSHIMIISCFWACTMVMFF